MPLKSKRIIKMYGTYDTIQRAVQLHDNNLQDEITYSVKHRSYEHRTYLESLYGICFFVPSARALMTFPRASSDLLMFAPSFRVAPVAPVDGGHAGCVSQAGCVSHAGCVSDSHAGCVRQSCGVCQTVMRGVSGSYAGCAVYEAVRRLGSAVSLMQYVQYVQSHTVRTVRTVRSVTHSAYSHLQSHTVRTVTQYVQHVPVLSALSLPARSTRLILAFTVCSLVTPPPDEATPCMKIIL